jgi:hypothetical protein
MAGKRWNGSSYVDLTTTKKRWNGSTWVDITTAKRWNGSTWIDLFPSGGGGVTLLLGNTTADFTDFLSCDNPSGSCPLNDNQSDVVVYNVSGGTAPYTVAAVVSTGPALTIVVNNGAKTITASTTVGRNIVKEGEIKVTVTDSAGTPNVADFYLPFSFSYTYTQNNLGPPFEPDYPPPEPF